MCFVALFSVEIILLFRSATEAELNEATRDSYISYSAVSYGFAKFVFPV